MFSNTGKSQTLDFLVLTKNPPKFVQSSKKVACTQIRDPVEEEGFEMLNIEREVIKRKA